MVDTTAVTRASGQLFKKCYSVVVKLICEYNGWVVVVKGEINLSSYLTECGQRIKLNLYNVCNVMVLGR